MKNSEKKFTSNPRNLPTESLLLNILGIINGEPLSKNTIREITNYLRDLSTEKVSIKDLIQFDGVDEIIALRIISSLELGKRFYMHLEKNKLDEDWDFADLKQSERQYGVHFFHHYTAKFIPQIPARIIRKYSHSENIIVDPFMGSGTTLVEAKMLGCHSYGIDTNPMAIKIAKAKTLIINNSNVEEIKSFLNWISKKKKIKINYKDKLPNRELFKDSHLWFRNDVAYCIYEILQEIRKYSPDIQNFIEVGLSTILKGMSNARMDSVVPVLPDNPKYIDRKHYYREVDNQTRNIPVYQRLYSQIQRMYKAILEFNKETDDKLICNPVLYDARRLSDIVNQCDLVVTSPPYWSAQNYQELHKLSMNLFNLSIDTGQEIGRDADSYLNDMKAVFQQINIALSGHFGMVIGHDNNKNIHQKLFDLILDSGFLHVKTFTRRISNQVSRAKQIKSEYVYIFKTK